MKRRYRSSFPFLDYNAESQRTQRFAENNRIRKSSAFSLRPLRLCVETFNQTDTLPSIQRMMLTPMESHVPILSPQPALALTILYHLLLTWDRSVTMRCSKQSF